MTRVESIENSLRTEFAPQALEILDEGHLHVGHAGAREGGGHYRVRITAARFSGLDEVARHRLIYAALEKMMGTEIHALSISARSPDES